MIASYGPLFAEVVAVLMGITFAFESNFVPFVVETDSLGVVNLVSDGSQVAVDIVLIINDIIARLRYDLRCKVTFVSGKADFVAHNLSKLGLEIHRRHRWKLAGVELPLRSFSRPSTPPVEARWGRTASPELFTAFDATGGCWFSPFLSFRFEETELTRVLT
ncbi:hypothetical protein Dsin_015337 [Dipteronia sinensis]|uniref:RNase H type-1 domain-containing protein n=1 Tax=Dipteronia sinensis TaxID=43782 RepID=A0AAE0ABL5_9ROSI|nr:hypothetical protein Dsin_015337 [Dipteronia sinensis]